MSHATHVRLILIKMNSSAAQWLRLESPCLSTMFLQWFMCSLFNCWFGKCSSLWQLAHSDLDTNYIHSKAMNFHHLSCPYSRLVLRQTVIRITHIIHKKCGWWHHSCGLSINQSFHACWSRTGALAKTWTKKATITRYITLNVWVQCAFICLLAKMYPIKNNSFWIKQEYCFMKQVEWKASVASEVTATFSRKC